MFSNHQLHSSHRRKDNRPKHNEKYSSYDEYVELAFVCLTSGLSFCFTAHYCILDLERSALGNVREMGVKGRILEEANWDIVR